MRHGVLPLILLAALLSIFSASPPLPYDALDSKADHDRRLAWFREARFGMFIHWGLYSLAAGEWNGTAYDEPGEWIQTTAKVPPQEYEPLKARFNPTKFDARQWVSVAKNTGMKYVVITTKHHDGFGMWPSKQGTWNIGTGPFRRDPLRELAIECRRQGLRLCFYHSIMDWHHPDYLPRRKWDPREASKADFERYVAYMKAQLRELLTQYGPISILWFDGEWEGTWTHERGMDIYKFVRSIQPNIIVNNRLNKTRSGAVYKGKDGEDYGTPEQNIPANGVPGSDWESCMTMNGTWGYKKDDLNWKSSATLIRNLVDCASKGGNYLLNIGPTGQGEIPLASVRRLTDVGKWMAKNGESIYGTSASPFPQPQPWGKATRRAGKLFLHVLSPEGDSILLRGFRSKFGAPYLLANPGIKLAVTVEPTGVRIRLPKDGRDRADTVIVLPVSGPMLIDTIPLFHLQARDAKITGSAKYEVSKDCIGYWDEAAASVMWSFTASKTADYDVAYEYALDPRFGRSTVRFEWGKTVKELIPGPTRNWKDFVVRPVGRTTLHAGETVKVRVSASNFQGPGVMNLRAIHFTPRGIQ